MRKIKHKDWLKAILIVVVLIVFLNEFEPETEEIKLEELSVDPDIINNLKYEIHIDCEYVINNLNNDTMAFIPETIELCKKVFPDLIEIIYKWKCNINFNCSDGYRWTEEDVMEWDKREYAPQQSVLSHWAWYQNPTRFNINDTGTFRICRATHSDCKIISNRTVDRFEYYNIT